MDNKFIATEYTQLLPNIVKNQFKKFSINVSFKTNNNILKALIPKKHIPIERRSGVYKIECDDRDKFYIGQTGRRFQYRFKEHLPKDVRKTKSNYAQHLIVCNHNYTNFLKN